jgi:hypothetical protein
MSLKDDVVNRVAYLFRRRQFDRELGTPGTPLKSRDSRVTHFTTPSFVWQPRT